MYNTVIIIFLVDCVYGFFSIIYPSHLLVFICMYESIWVFLPEINFTYYSNNSTFK